MTTTFRDRRAAGAQLAIEVGRRDLGDPVVLGLPRGGVPVGFEVADALDAPLDVLVARKVGLPGHEELGIGAIAEGGVVVADAAVLRQHGIAAGRFAELADAEQQELARRVSRYRGDRPPPTLAGLDVVLVDDGIATGVTAEAAIVAARSGGARRVLLAAPVGAPSTVTRLGAVADEVICLQRPERFVAVGQWYDDFSPTSDREVTRLLRTSAAPAGRAPGRTRATP